MHKFLLSLLFFQLFLGCFVEELNSSYSNLYSESSQENSTQFKTGWYDEELSDRALDFCDELEISDCPEVRFVNIPPTFRTGEGWAISNSPAGILYSQNYIYVIEDIYLNMPEEFVCAVVAHEIGHAYHYSNMNILLNQDMELRHNMTVENFADLMSVYLCDSDIIKEFLEYIQHAQRWVFLENADPDFIEDVIDEYSL